MLDYFFPGEVSVNYLKCTKITTIMCRRRTALKDGCVSTVFNILVPKFPFKC